MAPTKRAYRSERRTLQARETRRTIRNAASALFLRHGYVATSVNAIAEAAGVAPETVYATFGSKRDLLSECVDVAIVGDDEPVALLERPWAAALLSRTDARARLRAIVDNGSAATARAAAFDRVVREAAASDPKIAERLQASDGGRYGDVRWMVERLAECGPMRYGVEQATDLMYAIGGADVYNALVVKRGWSTKDYVDAMYDLASQTLFSDAERTVAEQTDDER
jgi:TetR/AcrR family transcriptional regulator, regulator of autoinduction and epiphytic fitness